MTDIQTLFDSDEAENEYMKEQEARRLKAEEKKQIEEMARHIPARIFAYDVSENSAKLDEKHREIVAAHLYRAGYRQQSKNVIELPCKIGETVYVVSQGAGFSCAWNVYQSRVTAIYLDRYNKLFVGTETERENVGGYVEVERVFLTKEEAEEELVRIINKLGGGEEQ